MTGGRPGGPRGAGTGDPLDAVEAARRAGVAAVVRAPGFAGCIPADGVAELCGAADPPVPVDALMAELLPLAQSFASPRTSDFAVGAVVEGSSGGLYLGANFEPAVQPLALAVHAEQSAVAAAHAAGESGLRQLVVTAPPCGHCRQFLAELVDAAALVVRVPGSAPSTLGDLLPAAFGPGDLGIEAALLAGPRFGFGFADAGDDDGDELTRAAVRAASSSYSPYTESPAGVALRTSGGRIHTGCYLENAAFNPSLSPFLAALARLRFAGLAPAAVVSIRLVQAAGARVDQQWLTDTLAAVVCPDAERRTLRLALEG